MKTAELKAPEAKPTELTAVMGEQTKPPEREKVLIVNEFGAEATPYKTDLEPWLEQGWKIKKVATDDSTKE